MKKLILFLLCFLPMFANVFELGAKGSGLFFERSGFEEVDKNFARFSIFGGYQFNSLADQIGFIAFSDKYIDEIGLEYALTLPSLSTNTPFSALPYLKAGVGAGNTYINSIALSHFSYKAGAGLMKRVGDHLRFRFEIEYAKRELAVDRSGQDSSIKARTAEDSELGFTLGIGYIF